MINTQFKENENLKKLFEEQPQKVNSLSSRSISNSKNKDSKKKDSSGMPLLNSRSLLKSLNYFKNKRTSKNKQNLYLQKEDMNLLKWKIHK